VPELVESLDRELEVWGEDIGLHILFGMVVNPYLISKLQRGEESGPVKRIFEFLERMASSGDDKLANVVATTICERLGDDPIILERARGLMGPQTRHLCNAIETFWGRG
jgi:hypothetical protein